MVSRTQIERGRTALFLSSNLTNKDALELLHGDRKETDKKIRELTWWPKITMSEPHIQTFNTVEEFVDYFNNTFRVDALDGKVTFTDSILFFTDLNKQLLDAALSSLKIPSSNQISDLLFALNNLMRATENGGITRAVGSTFFSPCFLTKEYRNWIIALEAKINNCLDFAAQYFPASREYYNQKLDEAGSLLDWVQDMRNQMTSPDYYATCEEVTVEERFANSHMWFTNITDYVWVLTKTHNFAADTLIDAVAKVSLEKL